MPCEEHSPEKIPMELRILRALCGEGLGAAEREEMMEKLKNYEWREAEHRVVFQAILSLGRSQGAALREQLPGAATRMGFPDIFWEDFFSAAPRDKMPIRELLRILQEG